MNECDRDCARCTYASCIVDERRININKFFKVGVKKIEKKKFFSPAEKKWFETEYDRMTSTINY